MKIYKKTNHAVDEHIAVMEALKGVKVDGAVLVTTPQVDKGLYRYLGIYIYYDTDKPETGT